MRRKATDNKPNVIIIDPRAICICEDITALKGSDYEYAKILQKDFVRHPSKVNAPILTVNHVAYLLGVRRRAIIRWYDWYEDDYFDKQDCPSLPIFYKLKDTFRAPRLWKREDLKQLWLFQQWISPGCFTEVKEKYKKGGQYPDDFLEDKSIVRRKGDGTRYFYNQIKDEISE